MFKKGLILILALIFVSFAFTSHAQVQEGDITLSLNPQNPKANDYVAASIASNSTDLTKAQISWLLNGQMSIQKVGQTNFSFNVGDVGTQTSLEIQIQTADGSSIDKKITINPSSIDMLWEAVDSYVPPFYEGKALSPAEGTIKVVAVTDSNNGEVYGYNWRQDDSNMADSSGYGKSSYSFKNTFLDTSNTVAVTISDLLNNTIGDGQITLIPATPKILFYERDPALGIKFQKSIDDGFTINPNGSTIVAIPYFINPKNLNSSDLDIKWSIDSNQIDTPAVKNELGIKPVSGQSGSSVIDFVVNNINTLSLNLEKSLNVNF